MEVIIELLKFIAIELCTTIKYDGVEDSILRDGVFVDELFDLRGRDGCKLFCFNPFSEVVDSYYCVLYTTSPFRKPVD